jgi:hypothetical protein
MWVLDRGKARVVMTSNKLMMMISLLVSLESLTGENAPQPNSRCSLVNMTGHHRFIQIFHSVKVFPQLFPCLDRLCILFGFTDLFKSIMMHAKLYPLYM